MGEDVAVLLGKVCPFGRVARHPGSLKAGGLAADASVLKSASKEARREAVLGRSESESVLVP
jgi:hypothetical protein